MALRRNKLNGVIFVKLATIGMAAGLAAQAQSAHAKMPPNPERLLKVTNCADAKRNLIEARLGSPLISAAKNARIVTELEKAVKRLCIK